MLLKRGTPCTDSISAGLLVAKRVLVSNAGKILVGKMLHGLCARLDLFSYTKSKVFSPAIMKSVSGLYFLFISHVANIRVACFYVYGRSFHGGPWDAPQ